MSWIEEHLKAEEHLLKFYAFPQTMHQHPTGLCQQRMLGELTLWIWQNVID